MDYWMVSSRCLETFVSTHCIFGRFNLLGQVAVTSSIDFGLAGLVSTTAQVHSGYVGTPAKLLGIMAFILLSQVLVNLASVKKLRFMIYSSICLNAFGVISMIIAVLAMTQKHATARFVFSTYYDGTGSHDPEESDPKSGQSNPVPFDGWGTRASSAYVALIGILMSQYTILGFDASAHLCEETRRAVKDAPMGMLSAIGVSAVIGFFVIIGLLFSIQDFEQVRQAPLPVFRILTDSCGRNGGLVLMVLIMLCVWHCGLFSLVRPSAIISLCPMSDLTSHAD